MEMDYVDVDILKTSIGDDLIAELTDQQRGDEPDVEVLERVNVEAVATIHNALEGVYVLPVADNAFIQRLVIDLMRIRLYARRDPGNVPDSITDEYDRIMKILEGLRKRDIEISAPFVEASEEEKTEGSQTGDVRYTTHEPVFRRGFSGLAR